MDLFLSMESQKDFHVLGLHIASLVHKKNFIQNACYICHITVISVKNIMFIIYIKMCILGTVLGIIFLVINGYLKEMKMERFHATWQQKIVQLPSRVPVAFLKSLMKICLMTIFGCRPQEDQVQVFSGELWHIINQ